MPYIDRFCRFLVAAVAASLLALPTTAPAQAAVIATVGSQAITDQDLEARTADELDAQRREYESHQRLLKTAYERSRQRYKESALDALVVEKVLALEAKARRTSPEALLAAIKPAAVSDAQLREFYASQKTQINQPYEEVSAKIKEYLDKNAADSARWRYLDSLRASHGVMILLEPLREKVDATGPARGPDDAPVTLVEFSDFQCPFCGRFEPVVKLALRKYPNQVRVIYRHFPLNGVHPDAQKAAEAAVCARVQGKFWEMHDLLFAEQTSLGVDALKEKARRLGLDSAVFNDCLDSGKARATIASDAGAAEQLGLTGTPSTFINGRFENGAITESELMAVIDDELRRAGAKLSRLGTGLKSPH